MKVQATIVALAIVAATINAAPVELEERSPKGGFKGLFGGGSKAGGDAPAGGAAAAPGAYNKDSAGRLNAGMGLAAGVGLLGANAMNTDATNNTPPPAAKRAITRTNSTPAKGSPKQEPGPPQRANTSPASIPPYNKAPDAATSSDYMNSAAGAIGLANMGMGVYNADQNMQAHQKRALPAAAEIGLTALGMGGGPSVGISKSNYQEAGNGNVHASGASSGRRSLDELLSSDGFEKRALPAAASWGLTALGMGGGPSVGITKSNSQSAGNGNVHMSGASSRRQLQDENAELQRRLFSFSSQDYNQQSAGNGNVVASGASSGGAPSNADKLMASMSAGAQQKQQKRDEEMVRRLFSFSSSDYNTQSAGNGNVHASGASSGGSPSNADKLAASMQAGAQQGGGKRDLMRRLISVNHSDQNQQVAGNGNVHMSGAKSGASPAFMASLNPATAGAA